MGSKAASKKARQQTQRQRIARTLAGMCRISQIQRENGEVLDKAAWLKVIANLLSGAHPVSADERRGPYAPVQLGLNFPNMFRAAKECGLDASREELERQIAETAAWRQREAKRVGHERRPIMSLDTIGNLLGVTDEVRREAKAWSVGTFGGSPEARAEARKERNKIAHTRRRRSAGAVTRAAYEAAALSRTRPWEAEGVSRRTWERRRATGKGKALVDASPSTSA